MIRVLRLKVRTGRQGRKQRCSFFKQKGRPNWIGGRQATYQRGRRGGTGKKGQPQNLLDGADLFAAGREELVGGKKLGDGEHSG